MLNEIVKYNKEWEKLYREEAKNIKKSLGKNCVAVHHIRDTSFKSDVCAVNGKIEIVLLATVKKADEVSPDTLRDIGYGQIFAGYKKEGETDVILWVREAKNHDNEGENCDSERRHFSDELRPEVSKWMAEQNNVSMGLALGMCFGMSIGMAIGSAMGNPTLGMTMGMSIGMCLGIALGSAKNKK